MVLLLWSFWIVPSRLVYRDTPLPVARWTPFDTLNVVLLADLHVGSPYNGIKRLKSIVAHVNGRKPDLVLILGDIVVDGVVGGHFVAPEVISKELHVLHARLGVYAVLGNHDRWLDAARVQRALESAGISVLEDTATRIIDPQRGDFWIAGVSDYFTSVHDVGAALRTVPDGDPVIVFTHNPDIFPDIPARVALTVAGHTHGGQVRLPFIGPLLVPSRFGTRYAAGHIVESGRNLFVSTGTGTSILPIRFGVTPEVVTLHVRGAGNQ